MRRGQSKDEPLETLVYNVEDYFLAKQGHMLLRKVKLGHATGLALDKSAGEDATVVTVLLAWDVLGAHVLPTRRVERFLELVLTLPIQVVAQDLIRLFFQMDEKKVGSIG